MKALALVLDLLLIIFWAFVVNYVIRLENIGCDCSKNWKRDYIKYYLLVIIPIMILRLFVSLPVALASLTLVFGLTFVFVVFAYIQELRKKKCECSEAPIRDILEIVNYIQIFLVGFVLILMLVIAIAGLFSKPTVFVIQPKAIKKSKK